LFEVGDNIRSSDCICVGNIKDEGSCAVGDRVSKCVSEALEIGRYVVGESNGVLSGIDVMVVGISSDAKHLSGFKG